MKYPSLSSAALRAGFRSPSRGGRIRATSVKTREDARRKDAIFDDPPTAAFQREEGLALIRENPNLLPEVQRTFDRKAFLDYFSGISEWIYRK